MNMASGWKNSVKESCMKTFWLKIISGAAIAAFLSVTLCCSFCLARSGHCNMSAMNSSSVAVSASHMKPNSSCPMSNGCSGRSFFNAEKQEKFEISLPESVSLFSGSHFISGNNFADSDLASFSGVLYEPPPLALQKSVPIWLFDRVLRL